MRSKRLILPGLLVALLTVPITARAAAPRLSNAARLTNGAVQLRLQGDPGSSFVIGSSEEGNSKL